MNKLLLILSLIIILFTSCEKVQLDQQATFSTPQLTGFICRDEAATNYYTIGNPNIKLFDATGSNQDVKYSILFYPNPNLYSDFSQERFHSLIYFSFFIDAPETQIHFWIEKGNYLEGSQNYSTYMGANYYLPNEHLIDANFNVNRGDNHFAFDVSKVQPGYYRAYIEVNGVLLWDNLIINKQFPI